MSLSTKHNPPLLLNDRDAIDSHHFGPSEQIYLETENVGRTTRKEKEGSSSHRPTIENTNMGKYINRARQMDIFKRIQGLYETC